MKPLRWRQYLGYGLGDAANNLSFSMTSMFLLLYYTDVAGISAGTAGTIFLVVRVWGGIADLVAGRMVDQTSTRWGRFRPYILFGSLPLLGLTVALFWVPEGWSESGQIAYAFGTYALWGLAYSIVNIPYGSLAAAMTQAPDERAKLSSVRNIGTSLTILMLAIVVSPQIEGASDLQRSLTITTFVFLVIGMGIYLYTFATSREQVERETEKVSLRETLTMARRNRPLVLLCLSSLVFLAGMFSLQTVAIYYARDVLGNADLYIVLTTMQTLGTVAASLYIPTVVAKIGKKGGYLLGGAIAVAAGAVLTVAPRSVSAIAILFFLVLGFGLGIINVIIWAMEADTVEYGEWTTGVRAEGTIYAIVSFTRKAGQGVGAAVAAYTIGIGGYVAGAASQSGAAVNSIRVAAGAVPAVLVAVAAAIMLAYPLTERAFTNMTEKLAARHTSTPSAELAAAAEGS